MIPHRLAERLVDIGYTFREDIIWYKKNNVSSSSKENFSQAYETILFLSKNEKCFTNLDGIKIGWRSESNRRRTNTSLDMLQYLPF